jgi:hypothetical protein
MTFCNTDTVPADTLTIRVEIVYGRQMKSNSLQECIISNHGIISRRDNGEQCIVELKYDSGGMISSVGVDQEFAIISSEMKCELEFGHNCRTAENCQWLSDCINF